MEPMNTLPFGQANITFNNECYVILSQPLEQMVIPYLWIEFCVFLITYLDTSTLDCFKKYVCNPWYDGGL
jgi:hypothetical protein